MHKSYYAIIPASVRYDKELTPNAKLLYGEITALCNEKGYCWASNGYFSELYQVSKVSISSWIKQLAERGYIKTQVQYKEGTKEISNRYITIVNDPIKENFNTPQKKVNDPIKENFNTPQRKVNDPIKENFKDNNTSNNTSNNTVNNTNDHSQANERVLPYSENEIKEIEKKKRDANKKALDEELNNRFAKIWKEYPRKDGKAIAKKHYKAVIKSKEATDSDILQGIEHYKNQIAREQTPKRFIKQGSTWFRNRCWEDEGVDDNLNFDNQKSDIQKRLDQLDAEIDRELYGKG